MADNSSVELIQNAYDAFTKGDMETVSNAFADDIIWHNPGRSSIAGTLHSKQEVFDFFGRLVEETAGTFHLDVLNVFGQDDRVVVLLVENAERNGKTWREQSLHLWRLKDSKAVEFRQYPEDLYASDEFWS